MNRSQIYFLLAVGFHCMPLRQRLHLLVSFQEAEPLDVKIILEALTEHVEKYILTNMDEGGA